MTANRGTNMNQNLNRVRSEILEAQRTFLSGAQQRILVYSARVEAGLRPLDKRPSAVKRIASPARGRYLWMVYLVR